MTQPSLFDMPALPPYHKGATKSERNASISVMSSSKSLRATGIEWTDATWNPTRGCTIVSEGCRNCYAMRQAHRHNRPGGAYEGLTRMTPTGPKWTGEVRAVYTKLSDPMKWSKPRMVFVDSMSDLFHERVMDSFIHDVFDVMTNASRHTYQILTKRPARMLDWARWWFRGRELAPNIWLGVSAEDQKAWDERVPLLRETPAAVRWVSAEPLLGPIVPVVLDIDWLVVGGESGPGARPMDLSWATYLRDECKGARVPFFMKQLSQTSGQPYKDFNSFPPELQVREYPR